MEFTLPAGHGLALHCPAFNVPCSSSSFKIKPDGEEEQELCQRTSCNRFERTRTFRTFDRRPNGLEVQIKVDTVEIFFFSK